MNSFQIHDKDGNAIFINELDKQACELWGTEVHPKDYASPYDKPEVKALYCIEDYEQKYLSEVNFWRDRQNWFDWIGWKIAQGNTSWKTLKQEIIQPYAVHGEEMMEYIKTDPRIWGFVDLIDLWESKGYVPVSLNGNDEIISKNGITSAQEQVQA